MAWRKFGNTNQVLRAKRSQVGAICKIEGCGKKVGARGWCSMHYSRWYYFGTPHHKPAQKGRKSMQHLGCSIEGCDKPYAAKGYCKPHYNNYREHGDPLWSPPICEVEGCETRVLKYKCCFRHRQRNNPHKVKELPTCAVDGCPHRVRGEFCKTHRDNLKHTGNPLMQRVRVRKKPYPKCREEGCANTLRQRYGRRYCYLHWKANGEGRACGVVGCTEILASFSTATYCLRHRDYYDNRRNKKLPRHLRVFAAGLLSEPCWYCSGVATSIDHIEPRAKGGAHAEDNLAPACHLCNGWKSDKSLLEFFLLGA
jgi:hypothetical protein